jgi:hypothetical protein
LTLPRHVTSYLDSSLALRPRVLLQVMDDEMGCVRDDVRNGDSGLEDGLRPIGGACANQPRLRLVH